MATQPKVNPILPNEARHFNGKSVTAVKVTLGDMTNQFGPDGVIQTVYEVLQANATPIIIGQVVTLATGDFDVYFEGDFLETNDYGSDRNLSFDADLQARIRDLGVVNGVDLSTAPTVALISTLADDGQTGNAGLVSAGGVEA